MAQLTKIQWCHHTWNPWRGCFKIGRGCEHCYAAAGSLRNPGVLGEWGLNGRRVVGAEDYWRLPIRWDRAAEKAGERRRVFCASLADIFEAWRRPVHDTDRRVLWMAPSGLWCPAGMGTPMNQPGWAPLTLDDVRERVFATIQATPHLDWLLLTKRPENVARMATDARGWDVAEHGLPPHVWPGTSVESHDYLRRVSDLMDLKARVRFLSVEPLLSDLAQVVHPIGNLWKFLNQDRSGPCPVEVYSFLGTKAIPDCDRDSGKIHWVIVGGESGPHARPCHIEWIRGIVHECQDNVCPVFVKQLGSNVWSEGGRVTLNDDKGGDPAEWPEDLRVREFPEVS